MLPATLSRHPDIKQGPSPRAHPSSSQACRDLDIRRAECGRGGVLAEGTGEAAEDAATTGSGMLSFEPADSSAAQPGLAGKFLL